MLDNNAESFGKLLKSYRVKAGLTQEELARKVHRSRTMVSNWERGMSEPRTETVDNIASALELSAEEKKQLLEAVGVYVIEESAPLTSAPQKPAELPTYRPPLMRPPRADYFQGRQEALAQVLKDLKDLKPGKVVTICGPGGIGKSALAAEAVWTLAPENALPERFPDGIIFHSFYVQPQAEVALVQIALSFDEEPHPSALAAAERALSGRTALLLLDGAEEADDLPAVLAIRNRCSVLVTSRTINDTVTGHLNLQPFSPDEALELLRELASSQTIDRETGESIVELIGRLPLAVTLVGRYLAKRGMDADVYCAWLEASPLYALNQGNRQTQSVPLLLKQSMNQVSKQAQVALAVIGWLALAPIPAEAVTAAFGLKQPWEAQHLLGELVAYGLLIQQGGTYEVSHRLIHTYARSQLPLQADVQRQFVAWLIKTIDQNHGNGTLMAILRPHVLIVQAHCSQASMWQEVQDLASAINDYLVLAGFRGEQQIVVMAALHATQAMGDRQSEGEALSNLGNAYATQGRWEEAISYYEESLAISREVGDRRNEGMTLIRLGRVYAYQRLWEEAILYYKKSLAVSREVKSKLSEGVALFGLGDVYAYQRLWEEAIPYYEQGREIYREMGERQSEGLALDKLGDFYANQERWEEAVQHYDESLAILREVGNRPNEGMSLYKLGRVYGHQERWEEAIPYYEESLAISEEVGDRRSKGMALNSLGNVYTYQRRWEEARQYFEESLTILKELGDHTNENRILNNLGNTYVNQGRWEEVIRHFEESLEIYREMGDHHNEGVALINLGSAYKEMAQSQKANEFWHEALTKLHPDSSEYLQVAEWVEQDN